MMWGQRRSRLSPEETAANAAAKAAREKAAMTCQCCAGKFLANTGLVSHHAYQRPGEGWQTASCMGARHLPFEVDRAQLLVMIKAIESRIKMLKSHRRTVKAEGCKIKVEFTINGGYHSRHLERTAALRVDRSNWIKARTIYDEVKSNHWGDAMETSFDVLKQKEISSLTNDIQRSISMLNQEQKRYDDWKQTHKRRGVSWVKIGGGK
jgi:hypothetical protein